MSNKSDRPRRMTKQPGSGKAERYMQPTILMALRQKPSYGYELIQEIHRFGFLEGNAPPGMIYRHLRALEEGGMVQSEWHTEGSGPAKRMYRLTEEGDEVLALWVDYLENQAKRLLRFIESYRALLR
jgi:PadR family transcriptional regulator PadR